MTGTATSVPPADATGGATAGTLAVVARFTTAFGEHDVDAVMAAMTETEETFAAGDRAVVRWRYRWTSPDGTAGHVRGVDVFRVRDGAVAEKLSYVKG